MNLLPQSAIKERHFRVDLNLTPCQKFIDANMKRFTHIRAGRKFGKTTFTLKKILDWLGPPNSVVWMIAPTYRQGRLISWSTIKRMIPQEALIRKPNDADMLIELKNGSQLFYMGSDDPDSLRGPAPTAVILDEAAYHKPEAWYNVIEPNLTVNRAPALFVSTPKGFNWFKDLEDEAKRLIEKGSKDWATFHFTIYDNPYIGREEIERIRESVDPMVWRQEYMAEYESAVGRVFNLFQDTERHVRSFPFPTRGESCYRAIDWGMRDDTGALWSVIRQNKLHIYREHAENGLPAESQARIIRNRTPECENVTRNIIGHDAAKQDVQMQGLTVQWHFSNAGIRPLRTSSRNKEGSRALLTQLIAEDRLVIHPECRKLRKQLLAYEWKDTAMEKTEDGNDDLVDTLHYMAELLQYDLFLTPRKTPEQEHLERLEMVRKERAAQQVRRYALKPEEKNPMFETDGTPAGYL